MPSGFQIRLLDQASTHPPLPKRSVENGTIHALLKKMRGALHTTIHWIRERQRELGWRRFLFRIVLGAMSFCVLYILLLWVTLPSIDEQTILAAPQSTAIVDRNGVELYRIHGEQDRTIIPGEDIPGTLKEATIAIEDRRFYERGCIDIRALLRAILHFGKAGGASTITRQLARNALNLQRENIISRKIKELILGCQLEGKYSKEDLLALYLNWIPFGQNAYGVEQASRRYFGISAKDLTLAQSAVLASLPQLPSYYSPYGRHVHTEVPEDLRTKILRGGIRSTEDIRDTDVKIGLLGTIVGTGSLKTGSGTLYIGGRADQVLSSMKEQGFITEEEQRKGAEELKTMVFKPVRESIRAPHFVLWAKDQVETLVQNSPDQGLLEQGGLTIETTLDWRLQEAAEHVIAAHKEDIRNRFMAHNVALVAMDPETREILAYVGNTDYEAETKEGKIDMAQVPRQPGSSFKPFIYAAAFQNGYGPATVLYDVPTKFGEYAPQNFEGSFWGLMSTRRALGGSRNIPAVKTYFLGGEEDEILELADKMGVKSAKANKPAEGYGAALGIGAAEVPLVEMVQGYATIADYGMVKPISGIRKVTDRRGALILSPEDSLMDQGTGLLARDGEQALDPRIAYEVTSVLSDIGARPNEYWKSVLSVPGTAAAAKTGTSNKCLEREVSSRLPVEASAKAGAESRDAACKKRRPDNVWTLGYTPTLVAGVWVGNATSEPLSEKADGLTVAAPIWKEFMVKAQKILKPAATTFPMPEGVVQAQISLLSGELPTECTPVELRRSDLFLTENAPSKDDPACVRLLVDGVTGLLASDECPTEALEERSFLLPYNAAGKDFPQWDTDLVNWVKAKMSPGAGFMVSPSASLRTGSVEPRPAASGSQLQLFLAGSGGVLPLPLAPTEKCSLKLTPGREVKPTLEIIEPAAGGSVSYPSFAPRIRYTVGSRVKTIEYGIDGTTITTVTSAPLVLSRVEGFSPPLRVPRTIEKSGMHIFSVTLQDAYGNIVSDEVSITFETDRSGPDIRLTLPLAGAEITAGSDLTMQAESADPEGAVKYIEFFIDTQLIVRKPLPPYEITYPANLTPGEHTVRAVATDLAGNIAEDSVTITVK